MSQGSTAYFPLLVFSVEMGILGRCPIVVLGKERMTQRGFWDSAHQVWSTVPYIFAEEIGHEALWGVGGESVYWNHVLGSPLSLVGDKANFSSHISFLRGSQTMSL